MPIYVNTGGGGGISSDELTAVRGDILKGKTAVTQDSNDEPIEGTLELSGNAADSHVLAGKTYYNTDAKVKRSGAMANRGSVNQALNAGGSYTIPEGYHNGSGKVTANSLASQTGGATAADGDVRSGKTYWKDGAKRTGTMAEQGAKTVTAGTGNVSAGVNGKYMTGEVTIAPTPSQAKSVTPAAGGQTVYPDAGKLLSSVYVGGIPSSYIPVGAFEVFRDGAFLNPNFGSAPSTYSTSNAYDDEDIEFKTNGYIMSNNSSNGNIANISGTGSAHMLNRWLPCNRVEKVEINISVIPNNTTAVCRSLIIFCTNNIKQVGNLQGYMIDSLQCKYPAASNNQEKTPTYMLTPDPSKYSKFTIGFAKLNLYQNTRINWIKIYLK